jgi:hypothetical protein
MIQPAAWRPKTGADSVPFPDICHGDSPEADAAYVQYHRDREEAARQETADEAIVRLRADADEIEHGVARFDAVLTTLVDALDRQEADLRGPDGERWRGLSLDECCWYGGWQVDELDRAHGEMRAAFETLDRERFRKAAAKFANVVADFGAGWKPREATSQGGDR